MLDELAAEVVQMCLPGHDEVIQTFLLNRLHEPLDEGDRVRRADADAGQVPKL